MSNTHSGNAIPEITREEHDGLLNAKRVSLVSATTIFAVVSAELEVGDIEIGAVEIKNSGSDDRATVSGGGLNVNVGTPTVFVATPTISAVVNTPTTISLNAGLNNIGFATVYLSTPTLYSVVNVPTTIGLSAGLNNIGFATVAVNSSATINTLSTLIGNITLSDSKSYIGLVSISHAAWSDPKTWIGLASISGNVNLISNVTIYHAPYSYYNQSSLVSGYIYHGFALPGTSPTTASFKIMRETLNTGEVLFGNNSSGFSHQWSSASLASLSYL